MLKRLSVLLTLLAACAEPTLDARNADALWFSFDLIAQQNPELAPELEQAILDIRHYVNVGAGSRKIEILGVGPSEEDKRIQSELMIQAALQGKTASDVIKLARALNNGDDEAESLLLSPVFF